MSSERAESRHLAEQQRGRLDSHNLALLTRWIELNRNVLVDYWDGMIEYTEDAINAIIPLREETPQEPQ